MTFEEKSSVKFHKFLRFENTIGVRISHSVLNKTYSISHDILLYFVKCFTNCVFDETNITNNV